MRRATHFGFAFIRGPRAVLSGIASRLRLAANGIESSSPLVYVEDVARADCSELIPHHQLTNALAVHRGGTGRFCPVQDDLHLQGGGWRVRVAARFDQPHAFSVASDVILTVATSARADDASIY